VTWTPGRILGNLLKGLFAIGMVLVQLRPRSQRPRTSCTRPGPQLTGASPESPQKFWKDVKGGYGSRLSFSGRLRGNGSRNRIRCAGSKQAGIVFILKPGDKGKYWKGGALCGDRVATKLPTIAETLERCVAGLCVAGKERKSRGQCERRR
jgi:hypothetical protein